MLSQIKGLIHSQLHAKATPRELALGAAVGVMVGMLPLMGLQFVLAVALAWMLKANHKLALLLTLVSNPWTMLPLYYFEGVVAENLIPYETKIFHRKSVEDLFLNHEPETPLLERMKTIMLGSQSREYFKRILAGSLILGPPAAAVTYGVVWRIATTAQKARRKRREARERGDHETS